MGSAPEEPAQPSTMPMNPYIAFTLYLVAILGFVAFTLFQRWVLRDRPVSRRRARQYQLPAPKGGTS